MSEPSEAALLAVKNLAHHLDMCPTRNELHGMATIIQPHLDAARKEGAEQREAAMHTLLIKTGSVSFAIRPDGIRALQVKDGHIVYGHTMLAALEALAEKVKK